MFGCPREEDCSGRGYESDLSACYVAAYAAGRMHHRRTHTHSPTPTPTHERICRYALLHTALVIRLPECRCGLAKQKLQDALRAHTREVEAVSSIPTLKDMTVTHTHRLSQTLARHQVSSQRPTGGVSTQSKQVPRASLCRVHSLLVSGRGGGYVVPPGRFAQPYGWVCEKKMLA